MNRKTNKTGALAETLQVSSQEAKVFGDEVNRRLGLQGHRSVSFAEIARVARGLDTTNRTASTVAQHLLQSAPHQEANFQTNRQGGVVVGARSATNFPSRSDQSPMAVQAFIDWGTVVYVHAHYATIELTSGERVNCRMDIWPSDNMRPIVGMEVEINYTSLTKEVLQILTVRMPAKSMSGCTSSTIICRIISRCCAAQPYHCNPVQARC